MKNKLLAALGIGIILNWLSLFFSYKKLPNAYEDITQPIATGGFPFEVFEYPAASMGNWPPLEIWLNFFLNLGIWILVGYIILIFFTQKIKDKKVVNQIVIMALTLSAVGIIYLLLKFD